MTFQVYVKPGSYKVGSQSIAANEQIDPRFNNSEVEWTTKERGATVLSALVVKIEWSPFQCKASIVSGYLTINNNLW